MLAAMAVPERGVLILYCGKRHTNLRYTDLAEQIGERGQRGSRLPRGFQKVDGVEVQTR